MTRVELEKLDRSELVSIAKEKEITNPHKVKPSTLIDEILSVESSEEAVEKEAVVIQEKAVEKAKKANKPAPISEGMKRRLLEADLKRKERVVVIDKQRIQVSDDGDNGLVYVSGVVGHLNVAKYVDVTSQQPQYLDRMVLQIMEDATIDTTTQLHGKATVDSIKPGHDKRFIINRVEGMTEQEIQEQTQRELSRFKSVQG
jgi:hypothetical protein